MQRRHFLQGGAALATSALSASPAFAGAPVRQLAFRNTHTGEAVKAVYWEAGAYVPDALAAVNKVLRDHRTGDVHAIDPRLLDLLAALQGRVEASGPFHVISGYRSPRTNAALHDKSKGVATRSLHMDGKAIDIRLPGVQLASLRDAAYGLKLGGVGYYASSDFVHVDTGRVRRW